MTATLGQPDLKVTASMRSVGLNCISLYPSRLNASTAFGPSQTSPFIRGVKWTPRNGKFGSGTWHTTKAHTTDLYISILDSRLVTHGAADYQSPPKMSTTRWHPAQICFSQQLWLIEKMLSLKKCTNIKLKPTLISKNCSYVCAHHHAQLSYTTQHNDNLPSYPLDSGQSS